MKAIVTVVGKDKVGIIAKVAVRLADFNINVLDISQTIFDGNFTMIMSVDLSQCSETFVSVKESLNKLGEDLKVSIRIQRTEIFDAMYNI